MVEEALALAGEGMQLCRQLRELFQDPRSGATARDAHAMCWLADYLDTVAWQEDHVRIRKEPDEIVGIVWLGQDQLVIQECIPDHAAARHNIDDYRGRRVTHVNDKRVTNIAQLRDFTKGQTDLRIRLAPAAARGGRRTACVGFAAARAFGAEARMGFAVARPQWPLLVREVCGREAPPEHYDQTCLVLGIEPRCGVPCERLVRALAEGCSVTEADAERALEAATGFAQAGERDGARAQLGQAIGHRFQPRASQALGPEAWAALVRELNLSDDTGSLQSFQEACRRARSDWRRVGLPSGGLIYTLTQWPLQSVTAAGEAACLVVLLRALARRLSANADHPPALPYPIFPSRWGLRPELAYKMQGGAGGGTVPPPVIGSPPRAAGSY